MIYQLMPIWCHLVTTIQCVQELWQFLQVYKYKYVDNRLHFFFRPEYIKKYMPRKKARVTSKPWVNFKNQIFWYMYCSVKKTTGKIADTFVPYRAHLNMIFWKNYSQISLCLSKKGRQQNNLQTLSLNGRGWQMPYNVERKLHINSIEKRVMRAIPNKDISEGDQQKLMSILYSSLLMDMQE